MRDLISIIEAEMLNEASALITLESGEKFTLLKNSRPEAIRNIMQSTPYRELRGLLIGDDAYWWVAAACFHGVVEKLVGQKGEHLFVFSVDRSGIHNVDVAAEDMGAWGYIDSVEPEPLTDRMTPGLLKAVESDQFLLTVWDGKKTMARRYSELV